MGLSGSSFTGRLAVLAGQQGSPRTVAGIDCLLLTEYYLEAIQPSFQLSMGPEWPSLMPQDPSKQHHHAEIEPYLLPLKTTNVCQLLYLGMILRESILTERQRVACLCDEGRSVVVVQSCCCGGRGFRETPTWTSWVRSSRLWERPPRPTGLAAQRCPSMLTSSPRQRPPQKHLPPGVNALSLLSNCWSLHLFPCIIRASRTETVCAATFQSCKFAHLRTLQSPAMMVEDIRRVSAYHTEHLLAK